MSGDAGQVAPSRPPPVAVHDYGNVFWEPCWIKPLINFRLFAVQSGGSCCSQRNLYCFLKLTQDWGACNDTGVARIDDV